MAEFDPTKPVQTRDGRPARIICTDRKHSRDVIVALVTTDTGEERIYDFSEAGFFLSYQESGVDLVNIPARRHEYVNCYANAEPCFHSSWETARQGATNSDRVYIGTVEIVCEDDVAVERKLHYLKEETRG